MSKMAHPPFRRSAGRHDQLEKLTGSTAYIPLRSLSFSTLGQTTIITILNNSVYFFLRRSEELTGKVN